MAAGSVQAGELAPNLKDCVVPLTHWRGHDIAYIHFVFHKKPRYINELSVFLTYLPGISST